MINIPSSLKEQISLAVSGFTNNTQLARVASMSDFCLHTCEQYPHLVHELLTDNALNVPITQAQYREIAFSLDFTTLAGFQSSLRLFRTKQLFRIAYRSLLHIASLEETLAETSALADSCIEVALQFAEKTVAKKYAVSASNESEYPHLTVVALGKLGGRELNFSSDVDLMFVFVDEQFSLAQAKKTSPSSYFNTVAQLFVKIMSEKTCDGFVFRVDLRLRPNGHSGPLVLSISAFELYYQQQGRDWERYAMLKARVLSNNCSDTRAISSILAPFVYRRYVDYSILDTLRSLKAVIQREIKLKQLSMDLKRGPGGIREVEFICQSLQIMHGGRLSSLQTPSIFIALDTLTQLKLLSQDEASSLQAAYIFLRRFENCLQMYQDRQVHALPSDELHRVRVCQAMAHDSWQTLLDALSFHQQNVTTLFSQVLSEPSASSEETLLLKQLSLLWRGKIASIAAEDLLLSLNFESPAHSLEQLSNFIYSYRCKHLSDIARLRLDKFMPLLILELSNKKNASRLLIRVLRLLEALVKRSAYLALLTENRTVLAHILHLFDLSPYLAEQISAQPFLLEVLIDSEQLTSMCAEEELSESLRLLLVNAADTEMMMDVLRRFKLSHYLQVAIGFVTDKLTVAEVNVALTNITVVLLRAVQAMAIDDLAIANPSAKIMVENFAILAYGKLGSAELGFASDLDLVFLHSMPSDLSYLASRLAQKILHLLSTRTYAGTLYQVDTRLRPSGAAGLLVSQIDAYAEYQRHQAWVWEHQAIIYARMISGSTRLKRYFDEIRRSILTEQREPKALANAITDMRLKMTTKSLVTPKINLKYIRGGLVDLEFLVQFLILLHAHKKPQLALQTNTTALITALAKNAILSSKQAEKLHSCASCYHLHLQMVVLTEEKTTELSTKQQARLDDVIKLWQLFIDNP